MTPLPKKSSDRFRRLMTPLLTLVTASVCSAQTVAPAAPAKEAPKDEDVIILSPFVVDATKDKGYYAANTLAGSRMKTNLSDLGSSISVITKQQMDDTASTDINDIFRYEVNTEGALTYTPGTQSFRNDGVLDVNAGGTQGNSVASLTVAGANRVRGLGAPSAAINYYPAIGSVPFDSYNTQSVELSRGPNSMLFGLGSPAGIANQTTAVAQLNRDNASITFRADQYGSFRGSLSFNKGLIKDKLAIYGAAVNDNRRFDRDPSYDKTKRFYGAITFKPFKKTTIKVNVERYDNDNHRPNTLTPRDFVTQWNLAGQPYYDPVTHLVKSLKTGNTLSMMVNNAANTTYAQALRDFVRAQPGYNPALRGTSATAFNGTDTNFTFYNGLAIFSDTVFGVPVGWKAGTTSPNILFTPGIGVVNQGRSIQQIADGQLVNWFQPTYQYKYLPNYGQPPAANPGTIPSDANIYANATWSDIFTRTYTGSAGWTAAGNGINAAGYRYPSVTDRSIYDWRSININSMNFGSAKNTSYNIELEQELPWDLFFNAGFFRQDSFQRSNYTLAQLNVSTLVVDTNKSLPDGTANPYFGKPYVEDQDPDSYINAESANHYRAMLAWTPDFTQKSGWLKWLGRHQVLGMWSRDENMATSIRQRLQYISSTSDAGRLRYLPNPLNNLDGTPTGWNRGTGNSLRRTYYLAAPGDPNGVVTRSAGYWDYLAYTGDINVYDYNSTAFTKVNVTQDFHDIDAGTGRNQRTLDSLSAGITSYLWNNRLIATFGVRKDQNKARVTNTGLPAVLSIDKTTVVAPAITNQQKWVNGEFQRDLAFNRWGPYGITSHTSRTLGGVLRPFQGWASIDNKAAGGSQFWKFVQSFGFSYNKSGNFNPPSTALGDFYGNQLPKPTGEGQDYGIQFSLLDNKLFARVTWFKASNLDENIAAPIVFGRLSSNIDETLFRNWARTISLINLQATHPGDPHYNPVAVVGQPSSDNFGTNLTAAQELEVQAAAEKIWKLPYAYYSTLPFTTGATRNANAKGMEAEINFNPNKNWTMKFTFGKQDTKYASVLKEFTPWSEARLAVWKAAKASDYLLPQYQNLATYNTISNNTGRDVNLTNFWSSFGYQANVFPENANAFANPEANYNGVVAPQLAFDRDLQGQSVQGQRKYRWSFLTSYTFSEGRLKGFSVGGNERWEDKAVIGYYGKASGANLFNGAPVLDIADVTRPVYDSAHYYTDLWVAYRTKILNGKVGMKIQLNVNNVLENGELRPVAVNYDGSPYSFRIIDPRQYILSTTFDF